MRRFIDSPAEFSPGIDSGFPAIDKYTGGLSPCTLTLVGSRRSMGKTSFALDIASRVAESGIPVLFFSLELPSEQVLKRLLRKKACSSHPNSEDRNDFERELKKLSNAPLYIDDTPGLSTGEYLARIAEFKSKHEQFVVIVDYLHLMRGPQMFAHGMREKEVSHVADTLKQSAIAFNVPVVALSPMSGAIGKTDEDRPGLKDFRESGEIVRASDNVLILTSDRIYLDKSAGGEAARFRSEFNVNLCSFTSVEAIEE